MRDMGTPFSFLPYGNRRAWLAAGGLGQGCPEECLPNAALGDGLLGLSERPGWPAAAVILTRSVLSATLVLDNLAHNTLLSSSMAEHSAVNRRVVGSSPT